MVRQAMLEVLGYHIFLTCNGSEAMSLYRQKQDSPEPIDLAIVDLTIPGEFGGIERRWWSCKR